MEAGAEDSPKLAIFKLCVNYKFTKDVDVCNRVREMRPTIFNEFLTANQIFERCLKEEDVFECPSSALYIDDLALASLQNSRLDINFMNMVDTNVAREGYHGDLYSYRAEDLLILNEITTLKKQKGAGAPAYQAAFEQILKGFQEGKIHKFQDGPKEPVFPAKESGVEGAGAKKAEKQVCPEVLAL